MNDISQYLPENVTKREGEGFIIRRGEKESILSNAVPIVIKRNKTVNHAENTIHYTIRIQYQTHDNKWIREAKDFSEKEIMSGKFMSELPIEVQTRHSGTGTIFKKIIQAQICEASIEETHIHEFGWHEKKFHWLEDGIQHITADQSYEAALNVASVLLKGNSIVTFLTMAMVHGPLESVLHSSGEKHDFVTFLSGPTGIGKTALSKKICGYLKHIPCTVVLSSDRKEMRKVIQSSSDMTVIVDDFNTSSSDRVISRQLQLVSEIIQTACDSGDLILDAASVHKRHNKAHIVVTSETTIRNVSTMNRCFLVNMQENIPSDLWDKISAMENQNMFAIFVQSFMKYIEDNYDTIIAKIKNDFMSYKRYATEKILSPDTSMNRIAETLAVQYSITHQLINYMKAIGIDDTFREKINENMHHCISSSGQELQSMINDIAKKKVRMELLPTLAFIFCSMDGDNTCQLAKNEADYLKKIKKSNEFYIGFQRNRGYISFSPTYMCKMIAEYLKKDNVSVQCLGKELSYYHLAYVEKSERKQSCRWHTEKKYFHVNYRQLIELVSSMSSEWETFKESYEQAILAFENDYRQ